MQPHLSRLSGSIVDRALYTLVYGNVVLLNFPKHFRSLRVTSVFIIIVFCRHVFWLYVHPDYIFLMYFVRCQLTVSVMLLLVLGPKVTTHTNTKNTSTFPVDIQFWFVFPSASFQSPSVNQRFIDRILVAFAAGGHPHTNLLSSTYFNCERVIS